jgi:hypothetical protein
VVVIASGVCGMPAVGHCRSIVVLTEVGLDLLQACPMDFCGTQHLACCYL